MVPLEGGLTLTPKDIERNPASLVGRRASLNKEFIALIERLAEEVSDRVDLSATGAAIRATHEQLLEVERVLFNVRDRPSGDLGAS